MIPGRVVVDPFILGLESSEGKGTKLKQGRFRVYHAVYRGLGCSGLWGAGPGRETQGLPGDILEVLESLTVIASMM